MELDETTVARRACVSLPLVSLLEHGHRGPRVTPRTLRGLATALTLPEGVIALILAADALGREKISQ